MWVVRLVVADTVNVVGVEISYKVLGYTHSFDNYFLQSLGMNSKYLQLVLMQYMVHIISIYVYFTCFPI